MNILLLIFTFLIYMFGSNFDLTANEPIQTKLEEVSKEEMPFNCIEKLMAKPSCVNRLNATNACKFFGATKETVSYVQKCVVEEGFDANTKIMAPINIMAICLGGRVSGSSRAKDNETFCKAEDEKKYLGISDTTIPKITEPGLVKSSPASAVSK